MAEEQRDRTRETNQRDREEPTRDNARSVSEGTGAGNPMERGSGQVSQPERPLPQPDEDADDGGGITNRPLEEERENQEAVPPRGKTRHGGA